MVETSLFLSLIIFNPGFFVSLMKRSVGNLITWLLKFLLIGLARYFLQTCTDLFVAAICPTSSIFSLIFLRTDTRLYLETLMLIYVPSLSSKFYFFFEFLFSALFMGPHHVCQSSALLNLCIIDDKDKLTAFEQRNVYFRSHDLIDIKYRIKIECYFRGTVKVSNFCSIDVDSFLMI